MGAMAAAAALVAIGGCNEPRRGGARWWAAWRGARAPQASNGSWRGALAVPVPLLSRGRRRSELFCSDATPRNSFFFHLFGGKNRTMFLELSQSIIVFLPKKEIGSNLSFFLFFERRLLSFQLPSSNTNEKFAEACVLINSNTRFDVLRQ